MIRLRRQFKVDAPLAAPFSTWSRSDSLHRLAADEAKEKKGFHQEGTEGSAGNHAGKASRFSMTSQPPQRCGGSPRPMLPSTGTITVFGWSRSFSTVTTISAEAGSSSNPGNSHTAWYSSPVRLLIKRLAS